MSPTSPTPRDSHMDLYLAKGQEKLLSMMITHLALSCATLNLH